MIIGHVLLLKLLRLVQHSVMRMKKVGHLELNYSTRILLIQNAI